MSRDAWTVAGAKAKFRELIERAKSEGPQKITKHGRTAVAIVATEVLLDTSVHFHPRGPAFKWLAEIEADSTFMWMVTI